MPVNQQEPDWDKILSKDNHTIEELDYEEIKHLERLCQQYEDEQFFKGDIGYPY